MEIHTTLQQLKGQIACETAVDKSVENLDDALDT